jgi:RND superfamily putative drug exporter
VRQRLSGPDAPHLYVTGPAGIGRDLIRAGGNSLQGTTWATIILVVVILLLVYRAPLLALVPLVTIAVSVWVALQLLALLTLIPGVYLINVSKVFAIVLLYGAGTDYCLFLISRYREELAEGQGLTDALGRSVGAVGGALAASAATVVCGLGLLGCAEFAKLRCAGPAIALSLVVALVAALTLTPALLRLLGRKVFWPGRGPRPRFLERDQGVWNQISRQVVARPLLIWVTAVLVLLPLALFGLCVRPNFKPTGELAPSTQSIQGLEAIQRHFTAGEIGPVTVLLAASTDWNTEDGRRTLVHLSRGFGLLPNVAEVRSLTQPLGSTPPVFPELGTGTGLLNRLVRSVGLKRGDLRQQADKLTQQFYLATLPSSNGPRYVTRLDVVLHSDPLGPESFPTLDLLETWLGQELARSAPSIKDLQAECYGVTVNARDLAGIVSGDQARVNSLVLGAILIILLILVRRPWLAIYLLATVLLSYYATLGATAVVGWLWYSKPLGEVDWRVPFFLFTILVAVGEDYNILLITRVLKERRRHGSRAGIGRALAQTGSTITSCGLIMAGTFGTLMLAGLGTLAQIGFALAFGVLLDTFIVRPFLVPAFTLLVWRSGEPLALNRPPRRLNIGRLTRRQGCKKATG